MGKKLPWLRLYTELPRDPKIRRLRVEYRWLWICILTAAGDSPQRGTLLFENGQPWTDDDLADLAQLDRRTCKKGTQILHELGMLTADLDTGAWVVSSWNERQFQSDVSGTERVRKHRKRKAEGT